MKLNSADINNIMLLIDLASSRGAFRGPELKTVGEIYTAFQRGLEEENKTTQPQPELLSESTDSKE